MPHSSSLADVITLAEVQSQADLKTFARGKAYFHEGAVSRLDERDGVLHASVQGAHRYSVELGVSDDGDLTYECSCPVGEDGLFSKHAVAVALSWLENTGEEVFHAEERGPAKPRGKRKTYEEQIREYVGRCGAPARRADVNFRTAIRLCSLPNACRRQHYFDPHAGIGLAHLPTKPKLRRRCLAPNLSGQPHFGMRVKLASTTSALPLQFIQRQARATRHARRQ